MAMLSVPRGRRFASAPVRSLEPRFGTHAVDGGRWVSLDSTSRRQEAVRLKR